MRSFPLLCEFGSLHYESGSDGGSQLINATDDTPYDNQLG